MNNQEFFEKNVNEETEKDIKRIEEEIEKIHLGLLALRMLREAEIKEDVPYEEWLNGLPPEIKKDIVERIKRWQKYGLTEEQLKEEIKDVIKEKNASYSDKRFNIPTGSYLRWEITRVIDSVVEHEDINPDGIGLISFDLNSLKLINDNSGHEAGNEYLKRVADIFKEGQTTKGIKEMGFNVLVAACGGDEFSILLHGKEDMGEGKGSLIERLRDEYENEIAKIDCSDLIDFRKEELREKFKDLNIEDNYKFKASAPGGFSTLKEIISEHSGDLRGKNYRSALENLMGHLIDTSDKNSLKRKEEYKAANPMETAINARTRAEYETLVKKQNIKKENEELKKRIIELEKRLEELTK